MNEESRPVSRVLSRAIIPLDPRHRGPRAAYPEARADRRCVLCCQSPLLPYLALLQVGFAMPALLPRPRCALTAPFHPCRLPSLAPRELGRSALCCTFRGLAPPRRYLAPDPPEPGLSSPPTYVEAAIAWPAPHTQGKGPPPGTQAPSAGRDLRAPNGPRGAAGVNAPSAELVEPGMAEQSLQGLASRREPAQLGSTASPRRGHLQPMPRRSSLRRVLHSQRIGLGAGGAGQLCGDGGGPAG